MISFDGAALEDLLVGRRFAEAGRIESVQSVRPNPWSSRNASLIAVLLTSGCGTITTILKGGSPTERTRTGEPWGPAYEANVYAAVLCRSTIYDSPFLSTIEADDVVWLILRWVEGALPLNTAPHPAGITSAATWLGRFHRQAAALIESAERPWLIDYGDGPVGRWIDLAAQAVARDLPEQSSLSDALTQASGGVSALLAGSPTLAHGDLYPANVLVNGDDTIPIDWEWAGTGAGEIDLAAMLDGWSAHTAETCMARYRKARWPIGEPVQFERRLAAARIFLAARWLGGHPIADGGRMVEHQLVQLRHGLQTLDVSDSGDSRPPEPGS